MSRYPIPKGVTRTSYEVSNSRFISTVTAADSVENARAFIKSIRVEMPDASHYVYAYRVGFGSSLIEGMSDDGEPSGTAGPPTFAVVRGATVGDIVLVTVRYFGGIKLGTGGLVAAYTHSAQMALAAMPIEEKVQRCLLGVSIAYALYERVKLLLPAYEAEIEGEEFAADVTLYIRLPIEQAAGLSAELVNLSHGQATPTLLD